MHRFIVPLVILVCGFLSAPIWAASPGSFNLVTYGDSITAGVFRTENGIVTCPEGVSREPGRYGDDTREVCYGNGVINKGGFQPALSSLLMEDGYTPSISNYGYSGIRSDEMIPFVLNIIFQRPSATHFLIMAGANDASREVSTSTVIANLSAMVSQVQAQGLTPIIATVTRNTSDSAFDAKTVQYSQAIRIYAAANNILLADSSAALNSNWGDYNSGDGLHLNVEGNNILSSVVHSSLNLDVRGDFIVSPILHLLLD
jgi:lysophospholipase L1-like esterase